ncbi:MAG: hypothetical protein IPO21_17100 [Bacteroidales bacterium]|nr:hypothetical protein [Bacteroidales bacterium]
MEFEYNNRDLSWLLFNYRVLEEAKDESLPLYERLKFLAIYSNNLEEFYRVRVSYYRQMIREFPATHPKIVQVQPEKIITKINEIVGGYLEEFSAIYEVSIKPQLEENGIKILDKSDCLEDDDVKFLHNIFNQDILPNLQPVILVKNKVRPFLKTGQIYLILRMYSRNKTTKYLGKTALPKYGL